MIYSDSIQAVEGRMKDNVSRAMNKIEERKERLVMGRNDNKEDQSYPRRTHMYHLSKKYKPNQLRISMDIGHVVELNEST